MSPNNDCCRLDLFILASQWVRVTNCYLSLNMFVVQSFCAAFKGTFTAVLPPGWRYWRRHPSWDTPGAIVMEIAGQEIGTGPFAAIRTVPRRLPPGPAQAWVRRLSGRRRPPRPQEPPHGREHIPSSDRAAARWPCPAGPSGPHSHLILLLCPPGNNQVLRWNKETKT